MAAMLSLLLMPFVGVTANGAELDLAQYRGKVVIVDFWASWCKPCRQSIPWLNQMRARYGERGLVIVGVNVDAVHKDAERFLRDVPIDFEVIFDPAGEIARDYELTGMPTSLLIDRSGKIVQRYLGFREAQLSAHETELQRTLATPHRPE